MQKKRFTYVGDENIDIRYTSEEHPFNSVGITPLLIGTSKFPWNSGGKEEELFKKSCTETTKGWAGLWFKIKKKEEASPMFSVLIICLLFT